MHFKGKAFLFLEVGLGWKWVGGMEREERGGGGVTGRLSKQNHLNRRPSLGVISEK